MGQWLPAPCNGGPCARAATRKPTRRPRGLTHNSRAGIPKRLRPNCHKRKYSQTSVDCVGTKRGGGPKTPLCKGKGPENPGVVAPFAVAGCRGNRRRAVVRRLGKLDLRPCPLRLRSSLLVLGCAGLMRSTGFSFSSTVTKAWNMSIASTELARCCVMVPISALAWQILQMTKVFLPLGLWASLRHHVCWPFIFLGRALESDRVSTMTCSRSTFLRIFHSRNTIKTSSFFRPRGVCGGHYLCTYAKPPGTLPLGTSCPLWRYICRVSWRRGAGPHLCRVLALFPRSTRHHARN